MNTISKDEALKLVRERLDAHQPREYRLDVVPDQTHEEDGWWIVSVAASRNDIRRYDYYDILAQVEREIEDATNAQISLIPAHANAA